MRKVSSIALTLLAGFIGCQDEPIIAPTLETSDVTLISHNTAVSGGNITSNGGGDILTKGVVWGTSSSPEINLATKTASTDPDIGSFIGEMTGLMANTQYFVRAYAKNSSGVGYGNELIFITKPEIAPNVTTNDATNVTFNSASIGGNVVSSGTSDVSERGIVYSQSEHPTITNSKVTNGNGTGAYTVVLASLMEKTKYFVRAYATSSAGTSYGNEISFSTTSRVSPAVQTIAASKVTFNSASVGGNVTIEGTMPVVENGIVYGVNQSPTITDTKIIHGKGLGVFSIAMTGLTENTKYFVRAYATSEVGTSYGNEINFTTGVEVLPLSYRGRWFDLSGVERYWVYGDYQIIFSKTEIPYIFESISIQPNGAYKVEARRMGWPNSEIFYLLQGTDTNAISIQSTLLATQSLWKVTGRSVRSVTHGTGKASLTQIYNGTNITWIERNDIGEYSSWTLTETSRDDWSVYLSRSDGARLKIDVKLKAMFFSATPTGTLTEIYKFTNMYSE